MNTCSKPFNVNIKFDPEIVECHETYRTIRESFVKECNTSGNENRCNYSIEDLSENRFECFLENDLIVVFNCTGKYMF